VARVARSREIALRPKAANPKQSTRRVTPPPAIFADAQPTSVPSRLAVSAGALAEVAPPPTGVSTDAQGTAAGPAVAGTSSTADRPPSIINTANHQHHRPQIAH
jgi:hypothetical protein